MTQTTAAPARQKTDWAFLAFIIGATYVKLYIKILAIAFYFLYVFYKRYRVQRLPSVCYFYLAIPAAGFISAIVQNSFNDDSYLTGFLFGSFTWLVGGLISWLVFVTIANSPAARSEATVKSFFRVNLLVCLLTFIMLVIESGHPMPYWYWSSSEFYGTSTGDHIKGVFNSNSVTNAMVCALGVIYFLYRKDMKWALTCMLMSLMSTSNLTLLLLSGILVLIFLFRATLRKKLVLLFLSILVIYPTLSPLNLEYINTTYQQTGDESQVLKTRGIDTVAMKKPPIAPGTDALDSAMIAYNRKVLKPNFYKLPLSNSFLFNSSDELKYIIANGSAKAPKGGNVVLQQDFLKKTIEKWYGVKYELTPLTSYYEPIKVYTHLQTLHYLKSGKRNFLFGAGPGNFSSKLAIKTTGLGLQGSYPLSDVYVSKPFVQHQLYSLMYVLSLPVSEHSTINMPNSVYNQIAGEYGLIGIILFAVMYLWFFVKRWRKLSYGLPILMLTLAFLGFEYWFEMLTLTVIFEWLMFRDILKTTEEDAA
jgi:hypothetical protein